MTLDEFSPIAHRDQAATGTDAHLRRVVVGCERRLGFGRIALNLYRVRLKHGSSVRVPDSRHRINSTKVIAEYHEFEGSNLRGYIEVRDPVFAPVAEIDKSCWDNLPSCPRISRREQSSNMIRSAIEYLEIDGK